MRYLVTGGAGFIGSHLTESLLSDGHNVVVIDNLSTGNMDNITAFLKTPQLEFIKGDILDLPELDYVVSKSDFVFHLAAAVGVELVVHDPVRTINTNVHGTERILKAASKYRIKTLIASTSEVYGKSAKDKFAETDDLLIGAPYNSRWSYACSKLLDEFLGMAYYRDSELPVIIARFFNTVGPRQTGRYGMVLPRFVSHAIKGEKLQVYGDGTQTRCFCHVRDTIRALKSLAITEKAMGGIYNIGSNHSISIYDLAKLVIKKAQSDSEIEMVPYEKAYEQGFEDMLRRVPDTDAINNLIGWQAQLSLENIISDVEEYIRKNGNP